MKVEAIDTWTTRDQLQPFSGSVSNGWMIMIKLLETRQSNSLWAPHK